MCLSVGVRALLNFRSPNPPSPPYALPLSHPRSPFLPPCLLVRPPFPSPALAHPPCCLPHPGPPPHPPPLPLTHRWPLSGSLRMRLRRSRRLPVRMRSLSRAWLRRPQQRQRPGRLTAQWTGHPAALMLSVSGCWLHRRVPRRSHCPLALPLLTSHPNSPSSLPLAHRWRTPHSAFLRQPDAAAAATMRSGCSNDNTSRNCTAAQESL